MLTFDQGADSSSGEFEEGSGDALPITTIDRVVADLQLGAWTSLPYGASVFPLLLFFQ